MRALRARPSVPMTVAASAGVLALLASSAILSTSGSAHVAILAVTVTLILLVSALIGERARMSAAAAGLRETNRMLRMGEELADFGYWRFVPDAGELECSMQARAIAGVAAGSLSFADAIALVLPADRHSLLRCLAKARAGVTVECRAQLRRADGQIRTVAVKAQCEPRGKSDPLGLFGVVCDISDKVGAEQKLIATRDAARVAAKAKGQFLATMSHEIRTPMTGVLGMIELLRGNPERADRARYLDAMQKSADLLMAILDDVLDFSKIESGKLHLDTRDFDFAALVRSTIDMYFNAAARKGLLLTLTADCAAAPVVRGDPVRLQQVLCNLISNAIKFTASGSVTVVVSSRAVAGGWQRWRVAVTDSGIGIRAVEQQRLFQPFSQADSARGQGGTGLGLSISRWLIEAMGGMLRLSSKRGRGSTFWFELGLAEAKDAALPAPRGDGASEPAAADRALRVLVAEDNAISQMVIGALLRRLGHQPTCVANGRLAVDVAMTEPFDCILMDMQMPQMDGIAATRAIRSSGGPCASAPIVALTADASAERRRFYDNAGLSGFMTKPINSDELRARLSAIAQQPARLAVPAVVAMPPDALPLDPRRLDELRDALGPRRVEVLLGLLGRELVDRPSAILRLARAADLVSLRHEAHSLKGAALSMGATGVATAAAALEQARAGSPLDTALTELKREVGRVLARLAPERPAVAIAPRGERRRTSA